MSVEAEIKMITEETLERAFEELDRELEPSGRGQRQSRVVSGGIGSGKTSAFIRLVHELALPLDEIDETKTPVMMIIDNDKGMTQLELLWQLIIRTKTSRMQFDELIDVLTPTQRVPSQAVLEQARRNAEERGRFLEDFPALTSGEVADLVGSRSRNRASLAHTWRKQGRIFAVQVGREQRYPLLQFDVDAGGPKPQMQEILQPLREAGLEGWQLALWFTGPLASLDDRRPVDFLDADPARVLAEAQAADEFPW